MCKIQKKMWFLFLGCVFFWRHNLRGQLSELPIQEVRYPDGTFEENLDGIRWQPLWMQSIGADDSVDGATLLLIKQFLAVEKKPKRFFRVGGAYIHFGAFFENADCVVEFVSGREFWPEFFQGIAREERSVLNAGNFRNFSRNMYQIISDANGRSRSAEHPQTGSVSSSLEHTEMYSLQELVLESDAVFAEVEEGSPEEPGMEVRGDLVNLAPSNSERAESDEREALESLPNPEAGRTNDVLVNTIIQDNEVASVRRVIDARALRLDRDAVVSSVRRAEIPMPHTFSGPRARLYEETAAHAQRHFSSRRMWQ